MPDNFVQLIPSFLLHSVGVLVLCLSMNGKIELLGNEDVIVTPVALVGVE